MRPLLLLVVIFMNPYCLAEQPSGEALNSRYQKIKTGIVNREEEKRKVLSELFKVTLSMKKMNRQQARLQTERANLETNIQKTSIALSKVSGDLNDLRVQLRARLRSLYKFNGQESMRLIFSSQSPSDLDRNLKILKIVADKDFRLIRMYETNIKKHALYSKKLMAQRSKMSKVEEEIKSSEAFLIGQQHQKNLIIESLDKEMLTEILNLEKVRSQSRRQASAGSSDLKRFFFELKGKLQQPVKGELVQGFGNIMDKKHRTVTRFKGHFYKTSGVEEVRSVFDGEVVFSGSLYGLGNTVIVSHGDHYYTVYGNNLENLAKLGEKIKVGDVVARSGAKYLSLGSGTYFEVRHFSEPQDPMDWVQSEDSYQISMNVENK
jgi:septal ring factor EnvC (AmiA/AmiB activator)